VGAEFGNHTWTHADFDKVSLEHYENEILQTDRSMKRDLGVSKVSYFRSPYLNDGPDHAKKNGLQWFLQAKGFREAPVTLDTEDWQFATPYDRAFIKGDKALMKRLDAAYMPYMNSMVEFFEGISQQVFDRKCALIYLLHANRLTAKKMPEVLAMLKRRGYKIVSLDRALQDPAYQSPDHYLGPGGFSWLIRWGLDKGLKLPLYPAVPKWVQSISPKD
jgi:peptidoglycan/xylan/chitin deacetylase (PgdA/CDA1 family)